MIETYTRSNGDTILIKDMDKKYLINAIAKLASKIAIEHGHEKGDDDNQILDALKDEAVFRMREVETHI